VRKAVAATGLVMLLAGCGGSSDPPDTLSAPEWRREASAICRDIGRQVRAVPQPTIEGDVLTFTATVSPLWKEEEERLRALRAPGELASEAEGLADALSEVNLSVLEIHIATQRRDGQRRDDAIRRGEAAGSALKSRSRDLGLPACVNQRIP
jgi:hypothetical protein